jgi:trehalose synthase-fused probable maltokinase
LLTATVDEEIESIFMDLPDDNTELEPIRGRGEEVRERLRLLTNLGGAGQVIRHHGDFHLGQTLWADDDWVILDFEGEPARSLPERRRKRSPLRDVAGMLRSFAYAASASPLLRGVDPPVAWEERARAEFLDGYRKTVDMHLVPSGASMDKLLRVFELEKAVYELRYELNNRPDWVKIPVAGILRMLEEEVPV